MQEYGRIVKITAPMNMKILRLFAEASKSFITKSAVKNVNRIFCR